MAKKALIRAIKTMSQTLIASIGTTSAFASLHWGLVLTTAGMAGLISLLMSLGNLPEEQDN